MLWLYLTIIAYLFFAFGNIGDKLIVSKYKTNPLAYAFYVGIMGLVVVALIPFGVTWPSSLVFGISVLAGVAFVSALYFMYKAVWDGAISQAVTIIGSASPIFTFILAHYFLGENLKGNQLLAFLILIIAIVVLSWPHSSHGKFNKKLISHAIAASFFFAISYVTAKYIYDHDSFISGFFWQRIGAALFALAVLALPAGWRQIKADWQTPKEKRGLLMLAVQVVGGLGVLGQNYALSLASVTLINALQAIQYAFVFLASYFLGFKFVQLREKYNEQQLIRKISALILIALGLFLIAI